MSRPDPTPLLTALVRSGALRPLDLALAHSLQRLDPATPDSVLVAAALASLAVAQGHAGLAIDQPRMLVDTLQSWPAPAQWQHDLRASGWVSSPDDPVAASPAHTPLVFEHGLVYLRRYREYEQRLVNNLRRIGHAQLPPPDPASAAGFKHLFAQLFPPTADGEDRQADAARAAMQHRLLLITGGPGTGKTTTIARLLVLLQAQARQTDLPLPRIALAAPTGRAAERMAESLRQAMQALAQAGVSPEWLAALAPASATVHRLLGTVPDSPQVRHGRLNPLPHDVIVVDEASMIDLPLMTKLVEAMADHARLILLGDPDQLPSVEAGDVLRSILAAAGRPGFPGHHVHLQRGYRQSAALQIAPLADAMRTGDSAGAMRLLRSGDLAGVHFHEDLHDPLSTHGAWLLAHWSALAHAASPADALAHAARLRLLTVLRDGPQGARVLNTRIEALLAGANPDAGRRPGPARGHFHGRLLVITENNHRLHLFNGDIGVCLRDADGALMAWFAGPDPASPRAFHPAGLPAHDSAFAMTVHKAQGSEFDTVWLLLPTHDNRVLSRELLYTGITRARTTVHLAGSAPILDLALSRHARRISGLRWRLREAVAVPPGE